MRPAKYLETLELRTRIRLTRLRHFAGPALAPKSDGDEILSHVVIELMNLWAEFARTFTLSCTLKPKGATGRQIVVGNSTVKSFGDAIGLGIKTCKRNVWQANQTGPWTRKDEPPWFQRGTLLKVCQVLQCSNISDISGALSLATRAFDDLPILRNFYAHRNAETAQKAKALRRHYSIAPELHPTDLIRTAAYGRPQPLLLDWFDDIQNTMHLLCQ